GGSSSTASRPQSEAQGGRGHGRILHRAVRRERPEGVPGVPGRRRADDPGKRRGGRGVRRRRGDDRGGAARTADRDPQVRVHGGSQGLVRVARVPGRGREAPGGHGWLRRDLAVHEPGSLIPEAPMNVLERDFFTDREILQDPIPYYRALHERGPVVREPHKGVFMLSRIDEILEVYTDHERFSAIVGPLGPLIDVPRPDEGETWAQVIERRRHEVPMGDQLMSMDPPKHTRHRALAGRLFTPKRLEQNEAFILALADELIDEFADWGEMEFAAAYARPFTLLVIADLLGVPREDHHKFRGWLGGEKGT